MRKYLLLISLLLFAGDYGDISPKFIPFLLKESDMKGYKLKQFGNKPYAQSTWAISDSLAGEAVHQEWYRLDEKEYRITYGIYVYESQIQAHNGFFYNLNSYAQRNYRWGSLSGSIAGDKSWTNVTQLAFIKNNVGVRIRILPYNRSNQDSVNALVVKVVMKIEKNLHKDIKAKIEKLRQDQILGSKYNALLADLMATDLNEFSLLKKVDSKWTSGVEEFDLVRKVFDPENPIRAWRLINPNSVLPPATCIELGRRSEWENEHGIVIGIDICEFTSEEIAKNAVKRRAYESDAYFLDNPLDPQIPTIRWWYTFTPASLVYVKNKTAVHIYQFSKHNNADLDLDFFANSAKKIAEAVSNLE
jgi:hypothetical protein